MKIPCAVVVLNYEGMEDLKKCFPSVVTACEADDWIHDLVLLDNHSRDGSPEWVEQHFPRVQVIRLDENIACYAFNEIAKRLSHEFCIFFNNDFIVEKNIIQGLLKHFEDPEVIAASPLLVPCQPDGKRRSGKGELPKNVHSVVLEKGFLEMIVRPCHSLSGTKTHTFHASSISAFRREKFLELGGYDPLLFPFAWIDADFSYRAWKAGYRVAHERQTYVLDDLPGRSTTRVFGKRYTTLIYLRNRLLTTWLNVTDRKLLLNSFFFAFLELSKVILRGHPTLIIPYWWCFRKIPSILRERKVRRERAKLSDRQVLNTIQTFCV